MNKTLPTFGCKASTACTPIVKRHARARRVRIHVNPYDGLIVTAPKRASLRYISGILETHRAWIEENLERFDSLAPSETATKFPNKLPNKFQINSTDKTIYLHVEIEEKFTRTTQTSKETPEHITLHIQALDEPRAIKKVHAFLKGQARAFFEEGLAQLTRETGMRYNKLSIRAQRSRWGSCSAEHTITLNRNLLFFPDDTARYVMIHELCHTIEHNHSPAFWQLVETYCPDYKQHCARLNEGWKYVPRWAVQKPEI